MAAMRAGNNFVTNGPLLLVTANGKLPGADFSGTVATGGVELSLNISAHVTAPDILDRIEVVVGGRVVSSLAAHGGQSLTVQRTVHVTNASSWVAVRAFSKLEPRLTHNIRIAHTSPWYVTLDGKPRCSTADSQYYAGWMSEYIDITRKRQSESSSPAEWDSMLARYRSAQLVYAKKANCA